MIGAYRIDAYVIASADGMLADASGVQPASLQLDADRRHFQNGLDHVDAVVHGRHSHEGLPSSASRRRLIVTHSVKGVAPDPDNLKARLWNPAGASFEAACAALGLSSGTVAVIGGPQVYTLFLKLGYDRFRLTRAVKVRLPGGLPVFTRETFGGEPDAALKAAGLRAGPTQWLDDEVTLVDWTRPD
jgi:dihydrofolate reductase